jgi:ABC-type transport system involved in cytochrome bd biosynthesis fused ATPase/permease subunit
MHAMIQDRFAHCTVISVSHDVESLLDFDRILLLAHGEIQDYDTPEALLSRNPSLRQALQT